VPIAVKPPRRRARFLWLGVALMMLLVSMLVFSDSAAELARYAMEYQRRIQFVLTNALRDVRNGAGSVAVWALATICFGYGALHTLGPGHGKAVVVAYFLDSRRPHAWIEGLLAGLWIAFIHVLAALVLASFLKTAAITGMLTTLRQAQYVDVVSYSLILLIGLWRLWSGLVGHRHEHPDGGTRSGWLLLTAAGVAPCAGALIVILLSVTLGILWAGIVGVVAIAIGMALTLAILGLASMMAHRLIIADALSQEIGRGMTIAASLIVIASAGSLLLGALE
jgi:ABC-type nickel/cobalt efflux system permease component RcnA